MVLMIQRFADENQFPRVLSLWDPMATTLSEDRYDLVRLAAAPNPVLAHIWQQAIEQEGIRCEVLGDYLDAGLGDIPGFSAELWVESADFARAEAILRQHQDRSRDAAPVVVPEQP
jgi:hypothetical protein